ncbi:hypothetical protein niasHT_022655 [Heterodera trifolii]|uniref:GH18 domain-containing protein n=1 Tax=Heterodera trifolii TaxID=157864 RepID=A0ABD2JRN8_9BILA
MAMRFAEDLSEDAQQNGERNWESHRIGEPAAMAYGTVRNRALAQGVVTQTELCDILKEHRVHSRFVSDLAVPYLVNKDNEFIAFDNKRSIQIKTVWVSLNGFAGIALHGVELDNANGTCPQGEPFPILRKIVETQICTKCSIDNATVPSEGDFTVRSDSAHVTPVPFVSSKEQFIAEVISDYGKHLEKEDTEWRGTDWRSNLSADDLSNEWANFSAVSSSQNQKTEGQNEKCRFIGRFSLNCAHNLSTNIATDDLLTTEICDSLLVFDHFELTSDGTVKVSEKAEKWMPKMGGENGTEGKKRKLWAEVNCSMGTEEWEKLLKENRHKIVEALADFIAKRNLAGIVLNCDRQQNGKVRKEFAELLDELRAKRKSEGEKCEGIGLALRLPLHRVVLSEAYDVKKLNQHAVTLLLGTGIAFSKQKARLLNPLYSVGIAQQTETQTQNGTFSAWVSEGLNAAQVVMEVPAFGLLQRRETNEQTEPKRIGRAEICKFQQKEGSIGRTQYDALCSYWNTGDEWVSSENGETAKYKVHWAIARQLGGVLLRSLDDDDPKNACRRGAFPLLNALHEARCKPKKKHDHFVAMRDLMGMHMSRG